MKKIICLILLILLIFFFMIMQANSLTSSNITMMLKKNQVGITFINDKRLLIHLNKKELKVELDNNDYRIIDEDDNEIDRLDNKLNISKDNNRIIINYQKNNLCILKDDSFEGCQYIYLIGDKNVGEIPSNVNLVIYGLNIKPSTILNNYNNWIDTHELKKGYYTTLIWDNSQYQLMRIPKKEYQVLN